MNEFNIASMIYILTIIYSVIDRNIPDINFFGVNETIKNKVLIVLMRWIEVFYIVVRIAIKMLLLITIYFPVYFYIKNIEMCNLEMFIIYLLIIPFFILLIDLILIKIKTLLEQKNKKIF